MANRAELALLAVLLLRGPQTPGELKGRTERMAQFGSLADVEQVLGRLGERGYVRRQPRRPGQKEDRFVQLLGGASDALAQERSKPPPIATASSQWNAAKIPSVRANPLVTEAIEAGLATANQVHM